ncbi:MAG: DUF2019 domain-containing protein [Nitrospirae bacterium]|nr:DUF2019 domain-containing protein [Nitrospirota bacterium]
MGLNAKKLVEQFAEATIGQNQAIMDGDAKLSNKYANKRIDCFRKLRQLGDAGREELATLFNHENLGVRVAAAAYLLKFKTEEALRILRELSKIQGLIGLDASETIKRWEEGTWHLDE